MPKKSKKKKKKKKSQAGAELGSSLARDGSAPASIGNIAAENTVGKAWKKGVAALAKVASQPAVHTVIDDVATLKHLDALRLQEARLQLAQDSSPCAYEFDSADSPGTRPANDNMTPIGNPLQEGEEVDSQKEDAHMNHTPCDMSHIPTSDEIGAVDSKMKAFESWLHDNGIKDRMYEIRASLVKDAGNGIFIGGNGTDVVREGTVVVRVPSSMMLSTLAPDDGLKWLFEHSHVLTRQPSIQLALVLLSQCFTGKRSFWFPYISTFPTNFRANLPLWWSIDELAQLSSQSSTLRSAARGLVSFARYYCHVDQLLASLSANSKVKMPFPRSFFSLNNFRWAMSVVMTRQNPVPFRNKSGELAGRVLALVPVMDMANHDPTLDQGTFFDDETDEICIAASTSLKCGDELCMFYGPRSNQEFLIHCGFVTDGNIHDTTTIAIQVYAEKDPLYKLRISVLSQQGVSGRVVDPNSSGQYCEFEFELQHGGIPSQSFMIFCENMLLSKAELAKLLRAGAASSENAEDKAEALSKALALQDLEGDVTMLQCVTKRAARVASYMMTLLSNLKERRKRAQSEVAKLWPASISKSSSLASLRLAQEDRLIEMTEVWCRNRGGVIPPYIPLL